MIFLGAKTIAGFGAPTNYAYELLPIANKVRTEQIDKTRLGIPYITIADSVNGLMISGATIFPGAISMGATWNIPLYEQAILRFVTRTWRWGLIGYFRPRLTWPRTREMVGMARCKIQAHAHD